MTGEIIDYDEEEPFKTTLTNLRRRFLEGNPRIRRSSKKVKPPESELEQRRSELKDKFFKEYVDATLREFTGKQKPKKFVELLTASKDKEELIEGVYMAVIYRAGLDGTVNLFWEPQEKRHYTPGGLLLRVFEHGYATLLGKNPNHNSLRDLLLTEEFNQKLRRHPVPLEGGPRKNYIKINGKKYVVNSSQK